MLSGVARLIANHQSSAPSKAYQKSGSFAPLALPSVGSTTTLSDTRQSRRPATTFRPLPSPMTGLPQLPGSPFQHAVPTTPMDRNGCVCRCFPVPLGPSPLCRRGGVHDFTFEACSGFTHITACWIAQPPKGGLCHEASDQDDCSSQPLVSYQALPTTAWMDPSSTGEPRRWGALRNVGLACGSGKNVCCSG